MSLAVAQPGLLTTVQAGPRTGERHRGVPASGAADALSLALANRLVGNPLLAAGLEFTLAGPTLVAEARARVAVTGADAPLTVNGSPCPAHTAIELQAGDTLAIGRSRAGARGYLALAGGLAATSILGSVSTYLPAGLGGHHGRALAAGDRLASAGPATRPAADETPSRYRPDLPSAWALRVCPGAEAPDPAQRECLFDTNWVIGRRADRMGLELSGPVIPVRSAGRMPSAPVFPGTLQCPESGVPFLLGIDAQTTGGYPRLLQVARCDRHLLGQLRPGDRLRLLPREPVAAAAALREKHALWRPWLADIADVL